MRHELVTRAAIMVVGAGLMLGGCATTESVERAQATADSARQEAGAAMGAAQHAQGTADQALSVAQSAQSTAQSALAAANARPAWKPSGHVRHRRHHRKGERG